MKTCDNCRTIYSDDYAGQCHECGRPMGSVSANKGSTINDMGWAFAAQNQRAMREGQLEREMKRGNYDNVEIPESVLKVAHDMLGPKPEVIERIWDEKGNMRG